MTTAVTRSLVAQGAEKIFANSPAFNAEVPMAGRAAPLRKLTRIVSGELPARVVRLSELLGAGKTFFLQDSIGHLQQSGSLDEATDVVHKEFQTLGDFSSIENTSARLLILDELDRKAGRDQLLRAIEAAARWQRDERIVVLTGDYSLRNQDLVSSIGTPEPLELEPLDTPLLLRAIQGRLAKALRQIHRDGDFDDEAHQAAEALIEPELLTVLIPRTDPPIATFREVLGILQKLAGVLPIDEAPCVFTRDTFQAFANSERPWSRPQEQRDFIDSLYAMLRHGMGSRAAWPPMHVHDFPWLTDLNEVEALEYRAASHRSHDSRQAAPPDGRSLRPADDASHTWSISADGTRLPQRNVWPPSPVSRDSLLRNERDWLALSLVLDGEYLDHTLLKLAFIREIYTSAPAGAPVTVDEIANVLEEQELSLSDDAAVSILLSSGLLVADNGQWRTPEVVRPSHPLSADAGQPEITATRLRDLVSGAARENVGQAPLDALLACLDRTTRWGLAIGNAVPPELDGIPCFWDYDESGYHPFNLDPASVTTTDALRLICERVRVGAPLPALTQIEVAGLERLWTMVLAMQRTDRSWTHGAFSVAGEDDDFVGAFDPGRPQLGPCPTVDATGGAIVAVCAAMASGHEPSDESARVRIIEESRRAVRDGVGFLLRCQMAQGGWPLYRYKRLTPLPWSSGTSPAGTRWRHYPLPPAAGRSTT